MGGKGETTAWAFTQHPRSCTHPTRDFNCEERSPFAAGGSSEPTSAPSDSSPPHTPTLTLGRSLFPQARPEVSRSRVSDTMWVVQRYRAAQAGCLRRGTLNEETSGQSYPHNVSSPPLMQPFCSIVIFGSGVFLFPIGSFLCPQAGHPFFISRMRLPPTDVATLFFTGCPFLGPPFM